MRLRTRLLSALLLMAASLLGLSLLGPGSPIVAIAQQPAAKKAPPAVSPDADAEMWRAVRKGVSGRVSIPDTKAAQLVQSEGDNWRNFRNGPLVRYGAYSLAGVIALLSVFFLWRGRIRVEHGFSGQTMVRFKFVERFAHWMLASSFIILALTGLNITFGKYVLLPVIGKNAFAVLSMWGKYAHNYVAFAFAVALVLVLVLWIAENIPNRHDVRWLRQAGGMFSKGSHPPAKKFNAGQKLLFWLVIFGGFSLVLSGLDLLFPFEMAMFSKTFAFFNIFGINLPTDLAPIHEMQLAALWHAIMALFMILAIIGHIYIGTLGMEGAFDAMGIGEVDKNWAREHHPIWVEEVEAQEASDLGAGGQRVAPAE